MKVWQFYFSDHYGLTDLFFQWGFYHCQNILLQKLNHMQSYLYNIYIIQLAVALHETKQYFFP